MKESDLDLIEIKALMELIQPQIDNRISGKYVRFWKSINHKLEMQAKIRSQQIDKEISSVSAQTREKVN